jgi:hypothetical protein
VRTPCGQPAAPPPADPADPPGEGLVGGSALDALDPAEAEPVGTGVTGPEQAAARSATSSVTIHRLGRLMTGWTRGRARRFPSPVNPTKPIGFTAMASGYRLDDAADVTVLPDVG